jgi:hypothetical protein
MEVSVMTTTILPRPAAPEVGSLSGIRLGVTVALAVWFLLVVSLGAAGKFVTSSGPPLPIAIGFGVPLLVFFGLLWRSRTFRDFVLVIDLRFAAGIQAWRFAGFGFLSLLAYHVLPAIFALPAGLGDMAIGFAAPWIIVNLARDPGFAASRAFVRWNVLGILDLVVAVSIGTLSFTFASGAPGAATTAPMAELPLLLIPVFMVPVFLMLHTTALLQSRRLARG